MSSKTRISTSNAPAPAHTFSQGVRKGPFVQVSGQGPVDPSTGEYVFLGDVAAQTTRTLENVKAIVEASSWITHERTSAISSAVRETGVRSDTPAG